MDSCFESYRLCHWSMVSDSVVLWQEDTANIRSATVPFTCPDTPKP
ncbi:MAG: hypothetical protein ABIU54_00385 [Candidatus Eisenbacteria bacterium]